MPNEKDNKKLKRLVSYAKNPDFARFADSEEHNQHLGTIAETLKNQKPLENLKVELVTKPSDLVHAVLSMLKGEKGDVGRDGKDGKDGRDGQNGKDANVEQIIETVYKKITLPKDGKDGRDGKDGISIQGPRGHKGDKGDPGRDGKDATEIDPKVIIKKLQSLKGNDRLDISHIRNGERLTSILQKANDGDLRWHGGAPTLVAGNNITLTPGSSGKLTIASTGGGGFSLLNTASTVNGSNQAFIFLTASSQPTLICIDGAFTPAIDNLGATQWTWNNGTKTATLTNNAPTASIFAIQ